MKKIFLISSLTATVLFFSECAKNPVTGKSQVALISEKQEIAMGKEADPQIIAEYGLYEDANLQAFINQKGKEMAAISHRPNLDYQFRIVNSNILNAFAVPGGYVYFTRGIMAHFNSEAEFAGVLGHEIGHITARHSVSQQSKAILGQIGLIGAMVVSPQFAQFGQEASQGLSLLFLKFGRDAERQSDDLGVEYSSKIGYDAQQMADFFTVLQREGEQSGNAELPTFLSTHPNPGDRHIAVAKKATEWKQKLNLTSPKINRNEYLHRIEGLVYGDDPREGYLENNVFYHPVLKFQFNVPANWNYQNTPQKVNMAPKDGKALMFMTLAQGTSLQQAANTAMQQYQLTATGSRETTVNGLPALMVEANQQQQGGVVNTLSYFIQYNNAIYQITGVTSQADYSSYANTFNNVMQSFRQVTDQAKLNKQPERIRIKTVGQTATLQQVLRGFNMADNRMNELALLNGMLLTDQVQKGTLIKVLGQ
ncbi:M48 family metalloprotease [Flavisolibacter tropicus]|uniref:Peptidase M48 n=1 Tax=Flavisolibacter tropicus TaxID=1492898 RepID=A0A172TVL4_9BACT|nr:M48 family metalloprotease [Flavisolibacter tropicus]ANE51119.1 peptidase M48 [Flavisolibacter tropicus]